MNSETLLLTPTDVAKRLQVNEHTVTQWLTKGLLRGYKIKKKWRISEDDLGTFLENGGNKSSDKPFKDPDQQPDSGKADRLSALAIKGQRF